MASGKRLPIKPEESPWIIIARAEAAYCEEMGLPRPKYSRTMEAKLASAADEMEAADLNMEELLSQHPPVKIGGQFLPAREALEEKKDLRAHDDGNLDHESLQHDHSGRDAFEIGDPGKSIV